MDFPCFNLGLSQFMANANTITISESHTQFNGSTPRFVHPLPATATATTSTSSASGSITSTAGTSSSRIILASQATPDPVDQLNSSVSQPGTSSTSATDIPKVTFKRENDKWTISAKAEGKEEPGSGLLAPPNSRFLEMSDNEILAVENARNEQSTDTQTKVYVKVLKDWCVARQIDANFEMLGAEELCQLLRRFYAEVRRQDNKPYSPPSMRCMRAAIQRHLKSAPYNRSFNIMNDPKFNQANKVYIGKLKIYKREGVPPPKHKDKIADGDLLKMMQSDALEPSTPVGLQRLVFVHTTLHFCRRGREGLHQLTRDSFAFKTDDTGLDYVTMSRLKATKNHPGDMVNDPDNNNERRMYATGGAKCPVATLRFYLGKLNPLQPAFYQRCRPKAKYCDPTWYENAPIGKNLLSKFMAAISEEAQLSKRYTNHCLRATSIATLLHAGVSRGEVRALSGHRCDASLDSYAKPSGKQKRVTSNLLQQAMGHETVGQIKSVVPKKTNQAPKPHTVSKMPIAMAMQASGSGSCGTGTTSTHRHHGMSISVSNQGNPSALNPVDFAGLFSNCTFSGSVVININNTPAQPQHEDQQEA